MSDELNDALETGAKVADLVKAIPGPAGIVGTIMGLALRAGLALSKAGKDPVVEITRLLSSKEPVAAVIEERESAIRNKFRPGDEADISTGDTDRPPDEGDTYD
jgi:hypothetical protein